MGDYQFKFPNNTSGPLPGPGYPGPTPNPGGVPADPGPRPGREFMGGPVPDGGPAPAPTRIPGGGVNPGDFQPGVGGPAPPPPGGGPTTMYPGPPERQPEGGPTTMNPGPPVRNPMPPVRNPMPPVRQPPTGGVNTATAASNMNRQVQAPRIPPMSGGSNDWYGKNAPQGKPGGFTPPPAVGLDPNKKRFPYR